jgi:hypothetical protein
MGRLGEDHVLVEDDVLGISAAVSESKDLLAGMPLAAGRAAVFDDARELDAQRRRRLRRNRVLAARAARGQKLELRRPREDIGDYSPFPLEQVHPVQAERFDLERSRMARSA